MLDVGLVAEEVAEIEPLLTIEKNGQVEGVKYDRIGVVLISAIQEQQTQISEQQKLIESQQKQISQLKKIICLQNSDADICREEK